MTKSEHLRLHNLGENNPCWGRKHTEEERRLISKNRSGIRPYAECKPVKCIETGKIYECLSDAGKEMSECSSARCKIANVCNGTAKTAYGYTWEWI